MRRKNSGYILLTLLVVTGLAGTISGSISGRERKYATTLMKESKGDLLNTIDDLSKVQLNFRPSSGSWSVRECVYHIAMSEKNLWELLEHTMQAPPNPEKRSAIRLTDDEVVRKTEDRNARFKTGQSSDPKNAPYKSLSEALTPFKSKREAHIKYIKGTTEDMRDHIVETPIGWIDAYQLYLYIGAHTERHIRQVEEIKRHTAFPKK